MATMVEKREELGFEATELRLGLPGDNEATKKRGFEDTVDLKLKLPTAGLEEIQCEREHVKMRTSEPEKPLAAKAQVVGWPPVRSSFRRNIMSTQSEKAKKDETDQKSVIVSAAFVKVSMDGAPYLRKIDLKMYKSYQELSLALEKMFSSFTSGNCDSQGINFMNESKLSDLLNSSEYVPTYEDKDGDWMLVGDVPWEMFVNSCKRLRIMKGSEAIGIAPKAMEKCKSRS